MLIKSIVSNIYLFAKPNIKPNTINITEQNVLILIFTLGGKVINNIIVYIKPKAPYTKYNILLGIIFNL